MKNIVLSAVAVLAMSSFAVAGGDIAPVEEPVVVPEPVVTDAGFYIGAGYGYLNNTVDYTGPVYDANGNYAGEGSVNFLDDSHNEFLIDAGYKFNSYVAVEGRYWFGANTTYTVDGQAYDISIDSWGLYVKPMYPVTDAFDIYALLGYASSSASVDKKFAYNGYNTYESNDLDGFSWGIGAAYSFTDNVSVFVDYTSLYNTDDTYATVDGDVTLDSTVDTWNFGLNYKF